MPLEDFTLPISFGGLAMVVFSLGLYPRLIKRFGALTMCRAGLLLGIPATVIMPLASLFTGVNILEQARGFVTAFSCLSPKQAFGWIPCFANPLSSNPWGCP